MESGKLTINRTDQFANRARLIKIFIDQKIAYKIKNGESITFELLSGKHTVNARIDWCGSPEISIEIRNDKEIILELGSPLMIKGKKNMISPKLLIQSILITIGLVLDGYFKTEFIFWTTLLGLLLWQWIDFRYSKDKSNFLLFYLTSGRKEYLYLKEQIPTEP